MRALISLGSEDTAGTNSSENLSSIIENLRGQGFTEFAVVPPNAEINPTRVNEIVNAAQSAGAQVVNGVFDSINPDMLSPTSVRGIAQEFADATIIGDRNAVSLNGGIESALAGANLSSTALTNAVSSVVGNPDLLDPRTLLDTGLAEGSRIFSGAYDQATEALRNIGGKTFVVPKNPLGGITETASGTTQATAPPPTQNRLQSVSSVRPWVPIRPNENRYNFLTGRKVFSEAGDGPPGNGGGSGPGLGGGTRNVRGVRGTRPPQMGTRQNVRTVTTPPPPDSGSYGQVEEGRFVSESGVEYTQSDIDSVEALRDFNTDLGGGDAQAKLTEGEKAYIEDTPITPPADGSQFPFIHPEDNGPPIHTFDTGDRRVDYVDRKQRPFHLPASEGDYVVTRTNDQGGEIIIYVWQDTDKLWFPFTIAAYEAEGESVPFKNLNNIVRQPV